MKKKYNQIINDIEKVRGKNNKNWMDILRLAYRYSPREAAKSQKYHLDPTNLASFQRRGAHRVIRTIYPNCQRKAPTQKHLED